VGVLAFLWILALPVQGRASDIELPGFDAFDPLPGTEVFLPGLGLVPFVGVPLGMFDFGPFGAQFPQGPVATGSTDTLIFRPTQAGPAAVTVMDVLLVAMQLVSVAPIDFDPADLLPATLHYLTLQLAPGPSGNTGTMTITDSTDNHGPPPPEHGTVTYDPINWHFDLRRGALDGAIAFSGSKVLSSGPIRWSHFPPAGALTIDGVNFNLQPCVAGPTLCDIFMLDTFVLAADDGTQIVTRAAPEPATLLLLGFGLTGLVLRARRRRCNLP
jgi:hypothetical protein